MVIFFPAVNWLYRLQMGLFTQLLSFNGLARRLPTICKKSSPRTSNSNSRQKKDVLKNIRFANYFMLAVFISLFLRCEISCEVWSFTTKTVSVRPCMLSKSIESDFSTLYWITENTATIRRQKWNFCRLSSAVGTVEWNYFYLQWIVGGVIPFLCALFMD